MIPTQAGYENSPISHAYMGGLEQKILFQSDQKNVFDQYNDIQAHHHHLDLHSKNINNNNGSENTRINAASQMGLVDDSNLMYKVHHHHQASSDDLFGSEYKPTKNPLIQYDTPSDRKYYDNNLQTSNNDCSNRKKLLFLNQQSTPKANEKCGENFNSASKLPQDLNNNRDAKDLSIAPSYMPLLPKKELFNDLLDSDTKNTTTQILNGQLNLQKSISSDPKKPSSLASSSLPSGLQKQQSAIVTGGDKYQSLPQTGLVPTVNTSSSTNGKSTGENTLKLQEQGNNSRNALKKQTGSTTAANTSSSTSSSTTANTNSSHNYHYYYNGNSSGNMNYPHPYPSQQGSSTGSSRGYTTTSNNMQQQQYPNNSSSTQSNSTTANSSTANYPYYSSHSSSSQMYPPHGQHSSSSNHTSHHHIPHHYNHEDMDYAYTDMYGYYYPPYPPMPVGDHIDKKEGDQTDNINMSASSENDEYKKYYYGHGSSAGYGYYPPPAQNTQNPSNSATGASSTSQNPSTAGSSTTSNTSTGLVTGSQNEYSHPSDKYDPYMRGYYDPKGYYPPPPPHSYYYPPMNDIHMTNHHQGSKKATKKGTSQGSYQMMPQSYAGMKGSTSTANSSKYDQGQDIYGHPMDASYHNPYAMHPHSTGIYCDSSYYAQDQQQPKSSSSSMNFKKPMTSAQSDKENIQSKSIASGKENQSLNKEKNNQTNKGLQKQPLNQSISQNTKKNQNQIELGDANDYYLDNQDSSQQSNSHEIRKRKRKNNDQLKILKIEYQKGGFWGKEKILEVAQITGLSESQVYKWCWDQKKKRLETFKKKLGTKLVAGSDQQYEDMSGDGMEDDSYKHTGSPEKLLKLNDESGVVPLKTNISKLSNDFTINQLQEKVLANKTRALQNITDKVLSRQNSKQSNQVPNMKGEKQLQFNVNQQEGLKQNQENINPDNSTQQLDDVSKRLHFNSVY